MQRHQLLVTLDVKPEAFEAYIEAMRKEELGARSEAGNLGFDLWGDAREAHTIYLLEYWTSEAALLVDHAKQPYYQHVRGMEAEALTGAFDERLLVELGSANAQLPSTNKSVGTPSMHLSVWPSLPTELTAAFDESAAAVRAANGNQFWQLYSNTRREGEVLLIEAWSDDTAREEATKLPDSANLHRLIEQTKPQHIELLKL